MQRVKLEIEYDGSNFYGWQRQKNKRTVQGEIEKALSSFFGWEVLVTGSSRTDAGVHALAQVAHFDLVEDMPAEKIALAVNHLLDDDVRIVSSKKVASNFSARYDVKKKTYVYLVSLSRFSPINAIIMLFAIYRLIMTKCKSAPKYF